MKTFTEEIADQLCLTVAHAPAEDKAKLAELLEEFARRYDVTYHDLRQGRGPAMICWLFDAMVEGSEARPIDRYATA